MSEDKKKTNIEDPIDQYKGEMDALLDFERNTDLNIYQRLHNVMKDVWYIQKKGSTGQYKTVEHDDVTNKVRPAIVKHGIVVKLHDLKVDEPRMIPIEKYNSKNNSTYTEQQCLVKAEVVVRFVNIDNPEDYTDTPSFNLEMDKTVMPISGKILSYAVKMAILKTLMLETGVREDENTLMGQETDINAVWMYNQLGKELFGDEWAKKSKKKIYKVTRGQTSEASRAPTALLNEAIKNLYALRKKKEEEPEKDIEEIDKEEEENGGEDNDVISDFQ